MSPPRSVAAPPTEFDEYRLVRPIGHGAMGDVYVAHDRLLDREVAIKFVRSAGIDPELHGRFLLEARAIARLSHPNVVTLFRVGEVDGCPFLVSEFVRGRGLETIERPLSAASALSIALGLSRGLAAAHSRGVLHRDIKPANAIMSESGVVKLLDFGLAELADAPAPSRSSASRRSTAKADDGGALHNEDETASLSMVAMVGMRTEYSISAQAAGSARHDDSTEETARPVGTPRYMAPEIWAGRAATPASDIYSMGALLYELCADAPPHTADSIAALGERVCTTDTEPLAAKAPQLLPAFANVIERCLLRDASKRFRNGQELCHALETFAASIDGSDEQADGNPYPGLRPFAADEAGLLFGRGVETQTVLESLRHEPVVTLAGDSGTGKSSLCNAGILPRILKGALGDGRTWSVAAIVPGRRPLSALLEALAVHIGDAELDAIASNPALVHRELRSALGATHGLVVFVDQLEELGSYSDADEALATANLLDYLSTRTAGLRVLLSIRGDALTRLAVIEPLGALLGRALHFLRPPSKEELRDAVVGPAARRGVSFASEALVDRLVDETGAGKGGLPLLQFTLSELWAARDATERVIRADALDQIGGVTGALSRHADGVVDRLQPATRRVVRALLVEMAAAGKLTVSAADGADEKRTTALAALVEGRLVVVRDDGEGDSTYELANAALVDHWPRLQRWFESDEDRRRAHVRISNAASEWRRLGNKPDLLLNERQLRDVAAVSMDELGTGEASFIALSQNRARRRRWSRRLAIAAVPLLIAATYAAITVKGRIDTQREIKALRTEAQAPLESARRSVASSEALASQVYEKFDAGQSDDAEKLWRDVVSARATARREFGRATRIAEQAVVLDARDKNLRAWFAELLYEQAVAAEAENRIEARDNLIERMRTYDSGALLAKWTKPGQIVIEAAVDATLEVRAYERSGQDLQLGKVIASGSGPQSFELGPGSYRVAIERPAHVTEIHPVLLRRGELVRLESRAPVAAMVADGFVFVPAGRFLYGSPHEESVRQALYAQPQRQVRLDEFLIARHEVTVDEWMTFLRAIEPAEREQRRPRAGPTPAELELIERPQGFVYRFARGGSIYQAGEGEPIRYLDRELRAAQDWRRFPVTGVSWNDAHAYVNWLSASDRVAGARLCTDREWERAARGADSRLYPHGDRLLVDDANHDVTYGQKPRAFGPDAVGVHPRSDSPFGVADLAANVWEWTGSPTTPDKYLYRGGGWYNGVLSSLSVNRWFGEATLRNPTIGFRVCASVRRNGAVR